MQPRDPKLGSIYQGFRYYGFRYIGVITLTTYCNFASLKKYFVVTGPSLYRGLLYRGSTVAVGRNEEKFYPQKLKF